MPWWRWPGTELRFYWKSPDHLARHKVAGCDEAVPDCTYQELEHAVVGVVLLHHDLHQAWGRPGHGLGGERGVVDEALAHGAG